MKIRQQFGGINTDIEPVKLPSGMADVALNVEVSGSSLRKRRGFVEFEDDVVADASVLNMFVAHFTSGDVYVVCKCSDGKLYQRRVYSSAVNSFTEIKTGYTHNATDAGFFYMYADRLHYFDRVGGSRWHPAVNIAGGDTYGTAYKAGIPSPSRTTGPVVEPAADGEKDGHYHSHYRYRNSKTAEVGILSAPSKLAGTAGACACSLASDRGGIGYTVPLVLPTTYECDQFDTFCSMGNTEYIERGGAGYECFSYELFQDAVTTSTTPGQNKADHVIKKERRADNQGGEPPGAIIGCYTGSRAIYGQVYATRGTPGPGATLAPDRIMYSILGFPTMVPQEALYAVSRSHGGTDSYTFFPRPYVGEIAGAIAGKINAMAYGAGKVAIFTPNKTYGLETGGDGQLYAVPVDMSRGCINQLACVGVPSGIYALGHLTWMRIGSEMEDLAFQRFRTTLDLIPDVQIGKSRMAYYGYENQVWCAVVQADESNAQRILIWDESVDGLIVFEPANLGETEGITCMMELNYPGAAPTMLLGTTLGRILQYPNATYRDTTTDYACDYRFYVGQERILLDQEVLDLEVHCGANCAVNVTIGFRPMRTSSETITQKTHVLSKDDQVEPIKADFHPVKGKLFQLEVTSAAADTGGWEIHDVAVLLKGQEEEE